MKHVVVFTVLIVSIISAISINDPALASRHDGSHHGEQMKSQGSMHHTSHNGMCAPGFTALDRMCVLDDRCGPGAYPGKLCMMNGEMKQYLRPLHQKHAGISADNIICAEGKHLMFKHHDATPACVNSSSVEKLKHRGWQTEKPMLACTMEHNPMCGMDDVTYGNPCMLYSQHMALKHSGECKEEISDSTLEQCDSSYPDICIHPSSPDLDCDEIHHKDFRVVGADKHGFDRDNDGIGCES